VTAVPLGETPSLCVLCPEARAKIARPGGLTDWGCLDRLDGALGEIVQRYARLSARTGGAHDFVRRAPGFHSRPPLDIHRAALRDPRTAPVQLGEPHAPLNLFISWATWIRTQRRQKPTPAYRSEDNDLAVLDFEWRYLSNALDWATRQEWIPTFSDQVKACLSQMRSVTGEPNPRPVGSCRCGHPLFPPTEGRDIRCGGCDALYDPLAQIGLARRERVGCGTCGHAGVQHSHDEADRPCNVEWCDCKAFAAEETTG
jgi:hypothetical protein